MSDVGFYKCNLKNADISEYQLFRLSDLRFAILPNGKKYDGRYRLKGDLDWAIHKYNIDVNKPDATIMANYYGVSVEEYTDGQNWANENIQNLENQNLKE